MNSPDSSIETSSEVPKDSHQENSQSKYQHSTESSYEHGSGQNEDPSHTTRKRNSGIKQEAAERSPYANGDIRVNVLTVLYCTSCSYKSNYQQLNNELSLRYPTLIVNGGEYPVDPFRSFLSKIVTMIQYALYALLFAGDMIFQKLGIAPPAIYYKMSQNKAMAFFIIMFLVGNISSQLVSTGAFEISLNNDLIFSKIQTGRMPSINEIDDILMKRNV